MKGAQEAMIRLMREEFNSPLARVVRMSTYIWKVL